MFRHLLMKKNTRNRRMPPAMTPPMMPPMIARPMSLSSFAVASCAPIAGSDSTGIPSAMDAAAAVPRREESVVCNASAVVEAGTLIVAVIITLAAATRMDTAEESTPALTATEARRVEVSE